MYDKFGWNPKREKKWGQMGPLERSAYAVTIRDMCMRHPDIAVHAIVVKKENVLPHIRKDGNKLYNYMVKLALMNRMARHRRVTLVPDPRSIKVRSGNSMNDYLQTELWFAANADTELETCPVDSANCKGIQFADAVGGIVQASFEFNAAADFQAIERRIQLKRLFFSPPARLSTANAPALSGP